ncbi:MAG TPA: DUF4172 domain-containing protein [Kiritimatiellia bacterium]|nr:DUF4172 domain-containing protein [Kiritimatiellia bacterium]HMP34124.1 DUF4172 domain-containing protein [Kiritimatiellia bacterium]
MQYPAFFTHSSFDLEFTAKQLHGIGHAAIDPHILRRKSGGSMYIHERKEWPPFIWGEAGQSGLLAEVRHEQGRLLGLMGSFGFGTREEVSLRVLTQDAVNTAEIEGETYNPRSVRSSIARAIADIQTDVCFNPKPKLVNRRLRSDRRGE